MHLTGLFFLSFFLSFLLSSFLPSFLLFFFFSHIRSPPLFQRSDDIIVRAAPFTGLILMEPFRVVDGEKVGQRRVWAGLFSPRTKLIIRRGRGEGEDIPPSSVRIVGCNEVIGNGAIERWHAFSFLGKGRRGWEED